MKVLTRSARRSSRSPHRRRLSAHCAQRLARCRAFSLLEVILALAILVAALAVIGELVASNRGLGFLISDSSARFDTNGVFAALVVLSILATILNSLVSLLSRRANRWKPLNVEG